MIAYCAARSRSWQTRATASAPAIIDADDGLRERELRKMSILSEAIGQGFRDRGVDELTSTLAAHTHNRLSVALNRWLDSTGDRTSSDHVAETLAALESLTAARA